MKHRQVTAVLLSIIVVASACVPIDALGAYAAESAGSTAVATVMEQDEAEALNRKLCDASKAMMA